MNPLRFRLLGEIRRRLRNDVKLRRQSLGTMTSMPHPLASAVFREYLMLNPGDPGSCPGLIVMEREIVEWLHDLLSFKSSDPHGVILSGGTEANLIAVRNALEQHKGYRIAVPESAHFSFDKIADIMGLKIEKIALDDDHRADVSHLEDILKKNDVSLVVATAGTTGLGQFDPIDEMAKISSDYGVPIHVDAAFGGLVFPFVMDRIPDFRFPSDLVFSTTVDPHKMGMVPPPCGVLLLSDKPSVGYEADYLSGGSCIHRSLLGTRQGASVAAFWAMINYLGVDGYKRIVKKTMEMTDLFLEMIDDIDGVNTVIPPPINIVGLKFRNKDAKHVQNKLRERGWLVGLGDGYIRVVIMPHHTQGQISAFVRDLKVVVNE